MGNYYSGVMNSSYDSELKHHGILGQKWGVRRFQNDDGTWTAAGKERYGRGERKIAKALKGNGTPHFNREKSDIKLKKLPQIRDAANQLAPQAKEVAVAEKAVHDSFNKIYDKLHNDPNLHEKYLNKAVDNYIKKNKPDVSREEIYNMFKDNEDEIDEGGVMETYMKESKDPDVMNHKAVYQKYRDVYVPFHEELNKLSKEMYPDSLAKALDRTRLNSALYDAAKEQASGYSSKSNPSIKNRVKNFINGVSNVETDSLKVSDKSLKRQMERNIHQNTRLQDNWDFKGQSAREERNLSKKFVKDFVKPFNQEKKYDPETLNNAKKAGEQYMREVAKIRLKSMGYAVNDKAIDNLVSKDWFKDSLWIQNTLASMQVPGVKYTSKDDMLF